MYMCMYVCMYVCMYLLVELCMCLCVYVCRVYVCVGMYVCIHIYIGNELRRNKPVCTYTHACMYGIGKLH